MKKTHIVFVLLLVILGSCSESNELKASEDILGFWSLDSIVVYQNGKRMNAFEEDDWTIRFEEDQLTNCMGGEEPPVRYELKDTEAGKGNITVHPKSGDPLNSKVVFNGKDQFTMIQSRGDIERKWHHSRITEEKFENNCGKK